MNLLSKAVCILLISLTVISCRDVQHPPCPACSGEGVDCKPVDQAVYVYCDEPTVISTGVDPSTKEEIFDVKVGECKKEGGEVIEASQPLQSTLIGSNAYRSTFVDSFNLRAPEICDLSNQQVSNLTKRMWDSYYFNLDSTLKKCNSDSKLKDTAICKNLVTLDKWHNTKYKNLSLDDKVTVGVLPIDAGSIDDSKIMLITDINLLKRKYKEGALEKLFAPHHYYCSPGPIRGTPDRSLMTQKAFSSYTVLLSKDTQIACDIGLATMTSFLSDGAGASGAGTTLIGNLNAITVQGLGGADDNPTLANGNTTDESIAATAATARGGISANKSGSGIGMGGNVSGGGSPLAGSGLGGGAASGSTGESSNSSSGSGSDTSVSGVAASGVPVMVGNQNAEPTGVTGGTMDYDSAKAGGGSKSKAGGDNPFGALSSLFGKQGGSDGASGVTGAKSIAFNNANPNAAAASTNAGTPMTDAQLEQYLRDNSGSSLFDIASRRYFRWGTTVVGTQQQQ